MKGKEQTIKELTEEVQKLEEKVKNTKEKIKAKKQDFAKRYSKDVLKSERIIGIDTVRFENIEKKVKIVRFLLENKIFNEKLAIKAREILEKVNIPMWQTHMFNAAQRNDTVSAIPWGILSSCPKGFYIIDAKLAELWIKFMEELM